MAHAKIFGFTPEEALADAHFQIAMLTSNYDEIENRHEVAKRELENLKAQNESLQQQLEEAQSSQPVAKLPDAAELLNQLKTKRKKSKTDLADMIAILEILEGDEPNELLE